MITAESLLPLIHRVYIHPTEVADADMILRATAAGLEEGLLRAGVIPSTIVRQYWANDGCFGVVCLTDGGTPPSYGHDGPKLIQEYLEDWDKEVEQLAQSEALD